MKIILAPDSFKGTMTSLQVINILEQAAKKHFDPLEVIKVPIADGGEGTVEALVTAVGGTYKTIEVSGPMPNQRVNATYGIIGNTTAVLEMAQASGLPLVPSNNRNPLEASTYGTGELIKAAMDDGVSEIIIGIGGSATNDGGIGALQALGVKLLEKNGMNVGQGAVALSKISSIDLKGIDPRIAETKITVICDVKNALTGAKGATSVFGPQKGVTPELFGTIENGMKNYENIILQTTGMDMSQVQGSGAAGGLGAALVAFLGATLKPGIETILDFVGFDELLEGTNLVITGEGKIDGQSIYGKVPVGIAQRCLPKGIKVAAIVGAIGTDADKVYDYGISSIMSTYSKDMTLEDALANSKDLLLDAADRMFRFIKTGMSI